MRKSLLTVMGFMAILGPSSAKADNGLPIWDSHGTQIGMWAYDDVMRHQFSDGVPREISFIRQGLLPQATFVYETPNCTGQRYFYWGYANNYTQVMPMTYFEFSASPGTPKSNGMTIWGNQISATVVVGNYGSAWQDTGPEGSAQCYTNINGGNIELMPVVPLDTTSKGWHPPFCASATATRCTAGPGEKMLY